MLLGTTYLIVLFCISSTFAEQPISLPFQVKAKPEAGSFAVAVPYDSPSERISTNALQVNRSLVLIHSRKPSTYTFEVGGQKEQRSTTTSETKQNAIHILVRMKKIYFKSDVVAAQVYTTAPEYGAIEEQTVDIHVTHPNGEVHTLTTAIACWVKNTRPAVCMNRLNKPGWFSPDKDVEVTVRAQIRGTASISAGAKLILAKNPVMSFGSKCIWAELPQYDLIRSTSKGQQPNKQTVFPVRIWTNAWSNSATSWEVQLQHDPVFETTGWEAIEKASQLFEKVRKLPNEMESEFFDVEKVVDHVSPEEFTKCCITRLKTSEKDSIARLRQPCCKSSTTTLKGTVKAGVSVPTNPTVLLATLWVRASEHLEQNVEWAANSSATTGYLPFTIPSVKLANVEPGSGHVFTQSGEMSKTGYAGVSVPYYIGLLAYTDTSKANPDQQLVNVKALGESMAQWQSPLLKILEIYSCHTVEVLVTTSTYAQRLRVTDLRSVSYLCRILSKAKKYTTVIS